MEAKEEKLSQLTSNPEVAIQFEGQYALHHVKNDHAWKHLPSGPGATAHSVPEGIEKVKKEKHKISKGPSRTSGEGKAGHSSKPNARSVVMIKQGSNHTFNQSQWPGVKDSLSLKGT